MSEEILINVTPQETRVAVMQLGVVQDMYIERSSSRGIVSNVYFGKVMRVGLLLETGEENVSVSQLWRRGRAW